MEVVRLLWWDYELLQIVRDFILFTQKQTKGQTNKQTDKKQTEHQEVKMLLLIGSTLWHNTENSTEHGEFYHNKKQISIITKSMTVLPLKFTLNKIHVMFIVSQSFQWVWWIFSRFKLAIHHLWNEPPWINQCEVPFFTKYLAACLRQIVHSELYIYTFFPFGSEAACRGWDLPASGALSESWSKERKHRNHLTLSFHIERSQESKN